MNARKIEIGVLSIDVPARNAAHARALAAAIERRLREMKLFPLPNASTAIETLRVDLPPWPAWASDAHVATVVATRVHRALEQALGSSGRPEPAREAPTDLPPGGAGAPLSPATQGFMEERLGHDFGRVRVHRDSAASALSDRMNARAVTIGDDIFLRSGETRPGSDEERRLLAHELTHVAQQRLGGGPAPGQAREQEVRAAARGINSGRVPEIRQAAPAGAAQASPLDDDDNDLDTAPDVEDADDDSTPDPAAEFQPDDAPFPAEFDPAHPMPKLRKAARSKSERAQHATFSDPRLTATLPQSGLGFVYVGTPLQVRGAQEIIDAIVAVGAAWHKLMQLDAEAKTRDPKVIVRPRIQVLAYGLVYGGPLKKNKPGPKGEPQFHKAHDTGLDVDVLVVRRDGNEGVIKYQNDLYSRELTREAIALFASNKVHKVRRILFGDQAALPPNMRGTDFGGPHENHFHVTFNSLPPKRR